MEQIIKAVERARGNSQVLTSRERQLVPAEIRYTQTRTAQYYPAWLHQHRLITLDMAAPHIEAYKVLRTRVSQRMRQNGWITLGVTSSVPGEGKTLTAVNLSISLAMGADHTVLLVDADLRRPSVHLYLGLEVELGLNDHLLGNVPFEQILVHPGIRHLVVAPGGQPVAQSSEALSSPRMLQLVRELRMRYPSRLVVFDLPPLLSTDDALAFAPYVDAMLLVVEEGKTPRDELLNAVRLLESANENLIGTVLNKSRSVQPTARYGY